MQHQNNLEAKLIDLETELEVLRSQGVFRLVPEIIDRTDNNGKWLEFKKKGKAIVDPSVPYARRYSIPFKQDSEKAKKIIEKYERTKKAEDLIFKIKEVKKASNEIQNVDEKIKKLRSMALALRERAEAYEAEAKALAESFFEYTES